MTLNEILQAIIDGKQLQYKTGVKYEPIDTNGVLYRLVDGHLLSNFRIKPSTVTINGFEVPAPLKYMGVHGSTFYLEEPGKLLYATSFRFAYESTWQERCVERGLVHSTLENAIMSCKARLGIDPYKD